MEELLYVILGLAIPQVVGLLMSKVNPGYIQGLLQNILSYVLKDEEQLDKVEDQIGFKLIDIGVQVVEHTTDKQDEELQIQVRKQLDDNKS